MEATGENLTFLRKIRPPSFEEAGLEDCALPPESIKEAFFKAASVVGSRAATVFAGDNDEVDGGCISDPWIEKPAPSDALVGIEPEIRPPGACAIGKGGGFGGNGEPASDVMVASGEGGKDGGDCLDGLRGLEIKDKNDEGDNEEQDEKKPTLVEGYFLNP
ncbi:hypothetical protein SOVF_043740 [Spinacia oleracea]|uniref:Uncharacterized protein n=1 Tax=Spinacia oleracea TaxID=3562 RepID=A0A9R0K9N8_SPIOL|nr:uncharacterized protein LOC110801735 [Spinacia oleracea]KNA21370.1 hypothetical protein SOVF_043740 [Spinacia oleracea]